MTPEPSVGHSNGYHTTQRVIISSVISAASALLVALIVFYVGFGYNAVTRTEIRSLINQYSPYAQDKAQIAAQLSDLHMAIHSLDEAVRSHQITDSEIQARLEAEVAGLRVDVNRLIDGVTAERQEERKASVPTKLTAP